MKKVGKMSVQILANVQTLAGSLRNHACRLRPGASAFEFWGGRACGILSVGILPAGCASL